MTKRENLVGQRFNKLVVIGLNPNRKVRKNGKKSRQWDCICDCGNKAVVTTENLKSGHTKSCGCIKINDLVGQTFGRLTVLEFSESIKGNSYWKCQCSCKNKTILVVRGNNLQCGTVKSCGCLYDETRTTGGQQNKKYNTYDLTGEYGVGWTFNTNAEFYFDLDDYDKIKDYCWCENENGYIIANNNIDNKILRIHRIIMNAKFGEEVDHIFHNKKDNRKIYLRLCNSSENKMNLKLRKDNTSGKKGVYYSKDNNNWYARIGYYNKNIHIGTYDKYEKAVLARDKVETNLFKEFKYQKGDNT